MEFGNKQYAIFFMISVMIIIVMIIGFRKKQKILKTLKFKNRIISEILKILFITIGSILIVLALLSPQKLMNEENEEVKGMNIYVLIDVSRSMMTEDIYPNRLEGAKRILNTMLKNLKGDRVGFIPFSDSAYIQMPLTDDYSIGKNYIDAIDGNLISGGGTELYQGLSIAESSFKEIESVNKTVVILSDGGDYDDKTLDFAKKNNINIYSVGIGTLEGGIVPDYTNGKKTGFIKDLSGSAVISKLNTSFLRKLAEDNNGKYYEVNNLSDNFMNFFEDIRDLERLGIREEKVKQYARYFQIPLFIGLIFIVLGFLLRGRTRDDE
ncbi:MAG: VWA domain-containing protein [Fusobacteriaceae bacterium]|jgi:Ca-activated chloride channel family protein|nr:VWA domain-containing protein [Fusobacteriaceae bacterium]